MHDVAQHNTSTGTKAAYKGYFSQTIYILHRILSDTKNLIFQPETKEDLAIFNPNEKLFEVVQVKDYSSPLIFSNFGYDFFIRCKEYIRNNTPIRIASFGEIGLELKEALIDKTFKDPVWNKLINIHNYTSNEADIFFELVVIEKVNKLKIKKEIEEYLKKQPFATYQKDLTLDILTHWVYLASVENTQIQRQDIAKKLEQVVKYINDAQSFLNTYGKNIVEIFNNEILTENEIEKNKERYKAEFYIGISARPEHIKADIDIIREEKIELIENQYHKSKVVIIHGASGQGKSSLAYRYLFNYHPFSYEIIDYNSTNFLDIINALKQLSKTLDQQIPIYIDVKQGNLEWLKITQELFRYPEHFKILVTIRDEDWNSTIADTFGLQFSDLELAFDAKEAEVIFAKFDKYKAIKKYPTFDDAWLEFGEQGPLLEFVYLLTQGITLEKRLKSQLSNPKYSKQHKNLLRLISFAGQFEAIINTGALFDISKLNDDIVFNEILSFFENEHLIRRIEEKQITTLHPIRATILTNLLVNEITPIQKLAINCIDIIDEKDYEKFLKNYFLSNPNDNKTIIQHLYNKDYKSWKGLTGTLNALLWFGVFQYVVKNNHLIIKAFEKNEDGWYLFAPQDILKLRSDLSNNIGELLKSLKSPNLDFFNKITNDYSDTYDALEYAKEFCKNVNVKSIIQINSELELTSFSELLYWFGFFDVKKEIKFNEYINHNSITKHDPEISSYLFLGLYEYSESIFRELINYRKSIINKFKVGYDIPFIEEKDDEIILHCFVSENVDIPENESDAGHWTILQRLNIARRLFPEKQFYSTKGYGFNLQYLNIDYDSTTKRIEKNYLPIEWHTNVNQYFSGLGSIQFRPESWSEYFENFFTYLDQVENYINFFIDALESIILRKQNLDNIFFNEYYECVQRIKNYPMFPKNIVDKYGKITEFKDFKRKEIRKEPVSFGLKKHLPLKEALFGFKSYFNNFLKQALEMLVFKSKYNDRNDKNFKEINRLSLSNLKDSIHHFDELLKVLENNYLKYSENRMNFSTNDLTYLFGLYDSFIKDKNIRRIIEIQKIIDKYNNIPNMLVQKLTKSKKNGINIEIKRIEKNWFIIVNTESIDDYGNIFEQLVKRIRYIIKYHENISLKRTILELFFNNIYIIPPYKQKLLIDHYKFKLSIFTLFDMNPLKRNPIFNIAQDLEIDYIKKEFNRRSWVENYTELNHFQKCVENINNLRYYVNFFSEVSEMVQKIDMDKDDVGIDIIKNKLTNAFNSDINFQRIIDNLTKAINLITAKLDSFDDTEKSLCNEYVFKPLENIVNDLLPYERENQDDKIKQFVDITQFPSWAKKLNITVQSISEKILLSISCLISIYEKDELIKA